MGWAMFWQLIFAKASEDGLEFRTLPHVSHESFYDTMPLRVPVTRMINTHLWGPQPEEKPKDDEEKDEEKEEKDNAAGWDVLDVT